MGQQTLYNDLSVNGTVNGATIKGSETDFAVGISALVSNIYGSNNAAIGFRALYSNTNGGNNAAIGSDTMYSNTTGGINVAIGTATMYSNTTGDGNAAIGSDTMYSNTTGGYNAAIGFRALYSNTNGGNNAAIGSQALSLNLSGSGSSGVGFNAQVTGSSQVQLGGVGTSTYAYGSVQDRSDERDKADIRDTVLGLDFINSLRPVDFKWDMREYYRTEAPTPVARPLDLSDNASEEEINNYNTKLAEYNAFVIEKDQWLESSKLANITHNGSKKRNRYHHGLIAQEVKTVLDQQGIDFGGYQDHTINGGDDVRSIGYTELIAPMIKAIQELKARIEELENS
jgi:hypothetical protein